MPLPLALLGRCCITGFSQNNAAPPSSCKSSCGHFFLRVNSNVELIPPTSFAVSSATAYPTAEETIAIARYLRVIRRPTGG